MEARTARAPDDGLGLIVIGGGGHATVVFEAARLEGRRVAGFLDDSPGAPLSGMADRLGGFDLLDRADLARGHVFILGVGELSLRRRLIDRLRVRLATVVHPRAFVSPTATLGAGVYVGPLAIVHTRARVEEHAILNSACVVEHDCVIGANTHVAPGAALGGSARVGSDTLVGLGSRCLPGVAIGSRCVVGAGAAVVGEITDGALVAGVPARTIER